MQTANTLIRCPALRHLLLAARRPPPGQAMVCFASLLRRRGACFLGPCLSSGVLGPPDRASSEPSCPVCQSLCQSLSPRPRSGRCSFCVSGKGFASRGRSRASPSVWRAGFAGFRPVFFWRLGAPAPSPISYLHGFRPEAADSLSFVFPFAMCLSLAAFETSLGPWIEQPDNELVFCACYIVELHRHPSR